MKDKPRGGRLERWFFNGERVIGDLHDDPSGRFPDGCGVWTSRIVARTDTHVETLNTIYELGKKL